MASQQGAEIAWEVQASKAGTCASGTSCGQAESSQLAPHQELCVPSEGILCR